MSEADRQSYLYAHIWACGSPCECRQAVIERYTPHSTYPGAWRIEEIWSGPMGDLHSGDWDVDAETERLRHAAAQYKITLGEDGTGVRYLEEGEF